MIRSSDNNAAPFRANAVSALVLQAVTAVIGIVLPRLILEAYGSATNGLVSSITQFLSYISLMEAGTGSVMRAAMYKPLATGDMQKLSGVVNACKRFFRGIAYAFLVYLIVLSIVYPLFAKSGGFSYEFVFWLVLILSINTFAQYFFGMAYLLLMQAHQKIYLVNIIDILSLLGNFGFSALLIWLGAGIHTVKLTTAALFLIRPVAVYLYVKKKYSLNEKAAPDMTAISQRWDGLGHHLAYFVHKNTDVVVLTFFSTYGEISVYSVYAMVTNAVQMALNSISASITAKFGNLFARDDRAGLKRSFSQYETLTFAAATLLFSVTSVLIVPFIGVYTQDISDANYIRNGFAMLLVLAEFIYAIRAPYSNLAFAVGDFKQTRNGAIIEAALNVGISLLLVHAMGISGVAIGTLIAMFYRTIDYVVYMSQHILCRSVKYFIKNFALSAGIYIAANVLCRMFILPVFVIDNFFMWAVCALVTTVATGALLVGVHLICNRKAFLDAFKLFF